MVILNTKMQLQAKSEAIFLELHEWAVASRNIKAETRIAKTEAILIRLSSRVKYPCEVFNFPNR